MAAVGAKNEEKLCYSNCCGGRRGEWMALCWMVCDGTPAGMAATRWAIPMEECECCKPATDDDDDHPRVDCEADRHTQTTDRQTFAVVDF